MDIMLKYFIYGLLLLMLRGKYLLLIMLTFYVSALFVFFFYKLLFMKLCGDAKSLRVIKSRSFFALSEECKIIFWKYLKENRETPIRGGCDAFLQKFRVIKKLFKLSCYWSLTIQIARRFHEKHLIALDYIENRTSPKREMSWPNREKLLLR